MQRSGVGYTYRIHGVQPAAHVNELLMRITIVVIMTLVLSGIPCAHAIKPTPSTAVHNKDQLNRELGEIAAAQALMARRQWSEALNRLRNWERSNASSPNIALLQAKCLFGLGRYAEVEEKVAKGLKLHPSESEKIDLHHVRAQAREGSGNLRGALPDLDYLVSMMPCCVAWRTDRIRLYARLHQSERGRADVEALRKCLGGNAESYCIAARYWWAAGKNKEAISEIDRGLAKFPKESSLHALKGHFELFQLKDKKAALRDLSRAIELGDSSFQTYGFRASIAQDLMMPDMALSDISKAIELSPLDPKLYDMRADIYEFLLVKPQEARKDRQESARLRASQAK